MGRMCSFSYFLSSFLRLSYLFTAVLLWEMRVYGPLFALSTLLFPVLTP